MTIGIAQGVLIPRSIGMLGKTRSAGVLPGIADGSLNLDGTLASYGEVPGPIGDFGGGSWNVDASRATTALRSRGMFGRTAPSVRPDDGSQADPMPQPQPPSLPTMGTAQDLPRRGIAQPFDYDAAMAAMLPKPHKKNTLKTIASILAPALMGMAGNQAGANAFIVNMQHRREEENRQRVAATNAITRWRHDDYARQQGADLRAAAPFTIGRDRLQYDPNTGDVATLYDGQEPFEQYAADMGLEPGSDDYFNAVQDYVLRANGPTALAHDRTLDDYRTGNRLKIEGVRQGNRESLEGIRQKNRVTTRSVPTYRDTHPRASGKARPTATGPNGEKMEYDGSAWVPVR